MIIFQIFKKIINQKNRRKMRTIRENLLARTRHKLYETAIFPHIYKQT